MHILYYIYKSDVQEHYTVKNIQYTVDVLVKCINIYISLNKNENSHFLTLFFIASSTKDI